MRLRPSHRLARLGARREVRRLKALGISVSTYSPGAGTVEIFDEGDSPGRLLAIVKGWWSLPEHLLERSKRR